MIKVKDIQHVAYGVPDLDLIERFMLDFGMVRAARTDTSLYLRGTGENPCVYRAEKAAQAAFMYAAFEAPARSDLEALTKAGGALVPADGPFGGQQVVLEDPDGYQIRVVHGSRKAELLSHRAALEMNSPHRKVRFNAGQRPPYGPAPILRLGHMIFKTTDIQRSIAWYEKTLGMKVSDAVYEGEEKNKLIVFMRCDRGSEHTDHHTVGLAQIPPGAPKGVHHTSYETLDLDAVGVGGEWLKAQGWEKQHVWGVGRHVLGSQVFDYWRDPFGNMVEHFADGDLFDASVPTTLHPVGKDSLYMWGPAVPQDFLQ